MKKVEVGAVLNIKEHFELKGYHTVWRALHNKIPGMLILE